MTVDHCIKILPVQALLQQFLDIPYFLSYWLLLPLLGFGRLAFPIFAFGIAQGCRYTHNKKRYLLTLFLFALVSEIPFRLAFSPENGSFLFSAHNVGFTLFLGACCCFLAQAFARRKAFILIPITALSIGLFAQLLSTDYGLYGILLMVLPAIFSERKAQLLSMAGLTVLYYFSMYLSGFQWIFLFLGVCCLLAFWLLWHYNGEKGKGSKWLFYFYYPLHLLFFYILKILFT